MRLKQLKLSGFKSFYEPAKIPLPGQISVIVGPNGCGKSNIIDAIRWCLGESSARSLRGDSMSDVIFNGSSKRKPLGQAAVELLFDNSSGRLSGAMSAYAEFSIKRSVNRDGESHYYLNGNRCRRRDITDVFLGTGANARGYSIIGQGTISRIIEARPEELRAFLEEAAGVSKYRERRRETRQRIDHTRENLLRVEDLREELAKQLQKLEKQAASATRFHHLKDRELACRSDISALKWQHLNQAREALLERLTSSLITIDRLRSERISLEKDEALLQVDKQQVSDTLQDVQARFYQLATEIARLEETLIRQKNEKQQFEADKALLRQDMSTIETQLQEDKALLEQSKAAWQALNFSLETAQEEVFTCEAFYQEEQDNYQAQQKQQQATNQSIAALEHQQKKRQLELEHVTGRRQELQIRLKDNETAYTEIDLQALTSELKKAQTALDEGALELNQKEQHFSELLKEETSLRQNLLETEQEINRQFDAFQKQTTQLSALIASQKAAVGAHSAALDAPWDACRRLVDALSVEEAWFEAFELLLGDMLQALLVENLNEPALNDLPYHALCLMQKPAAKGQTLMDKIKQDYPALPLDLTSIYTAETRSQAIKMLPDLKAHESVMTREGAWFGKGWVKIRQKNTKDQQGLLARQKEIVLLEQDVAKKEEVLERLRCQRDQDNLALQAKQQQIAVMREGLAAIKEAVSAQRLAQERSQQACIDAEKRVQSLQLESEKLRDQLFDIEEKLKTLEQAQSESEDVLKALQVQRDQQGQALNHAILKEAAERLDLARKAFHQLSLQTQSTQLKIEQYESTMQRGGERLEKLKIRFAELLQKSEASLTPCENNEEKLTQSLSEHQALEALRDEWQQRLQSVQEKINTCSLQIKESEKNLAKEEENKAEISLKEQTLAVKMQTLIEAEATSMEALKQRLEGMAESLSIENKAQELESLVNQIQKLGAINLAAIDEYQQVAERKAAIDKQYEDLMQALERLEEAICKMDNETRARLEQSFSEVNDSFQRLFPKIFGGGKASLQTTTENMLEAGIIVTAQPPGKRNASIQLLSGGEKAMSALALVFAIFQLNPSPFCILDEVDAPLDDTNISRFCDLLKEMSEYIQFLVISHNKITMETGDHLIGVTMKEPGVSRLVSVDIQQALQVE